MSKPASDRPKISDDDYYDLMLIDLMIQLSNGVPVSEVKPRFSKADYERDRGR